MALILVIDDDSQFVRLLEKVLGPHGHQLLVATSALSGLRLARENDVQLVLLDINLPDLDGQLVAAILHPGMKKRNVPVVAISAQDDDAIRHSLMSLGCAGFISKPLDTRQFPAQIAAFLESSGA